MQIFNNERRIRRGRFLATSLSVSGILMLLSSWVGVVFFVQSVGLSTFPLLILGVVFSVIGIHFTRKWVRLPLSHLTLTSALKGVGKETVLLNYWSPVDHLLLTPNGAFSLLTKNQPFDLQIDGTQWTDNAPLRERLQRALARDTIGNPIRAAQRDADKASKWLSKLLGKQMTVQPIIVFLNQKTHLQVIEQPGVPVAYADKRTPTLKGFLKAENTLALTNDDLTKILSSIEAIA